MFLNTLLVSSTAGTLDTGVGAPLSLHSKIADRMCKYSAYSPEAPSEAILDRWCDVACGPRTLAGQRNGTV